jgi:hypothetical protein
MIGIGFDTERKLAEVAAYAAKHGTTKTVVLYSAPYSLDVEGMSMDAVEYAEIIMYRTYYRLLQEIGPHTLIVVNECLRTQNRNDLTYNCIRHFIAQTDHVLVFQERPLIDTVDDFAVLFDFVTQSRWKRLAFGALPLNEAQIVLAPKQYGIRPVLVEVDDKTKAKYAATKRDLVDNLGLRNPHIIPRNLHLLGGKVRASVLKWGQTYVARNARIKSPQIVTYPDVSGPVSVMDFPHRFIDWSDFLSHSRQAEVEAIVTDLKVDQWYLQRFQAWCTRVNDAQAALHG